MANFLKVTVFSLLVVVFFAAYSNYGVPRIEPAPPPKEEMLDLGAMSMDRFIALGEKIFSGKGTCTLCHNPVGGRAPILARMGQVTEARLEDTRYKGKAKNVETYLIESMVEPSAFVVAGLGKSGTNDTVSPMPNAATGSIGLSDAELKAVAAYLQNASGLEVTVRIPKDVPKEEAEAAEGEQREPFTKVEDAIAEFACGACHRVGEEEGEQGPDLRKIGAVRDKDYLRRAILDPNAEIAKGFEKGAMPDDYGVQMYAKELEMMVDYLAGLK